MAREIRQKKNEIVELTGQIELYQQRVENTPKREQEMVSLNRDYGNIKESYDSLVQRKLEAEISVNMEKKQKGEQFRIIDNATLPEKPYSPNVEMLFLLSVASGLGIGGGLIFLFDFLNTSLKLPQDYETQFGLPVLATIPSIPQTGNRILRRINQGLTFVSLSVAVALTAGAVLDPLAKRRWFRLGLHFGLFQALMPVAGWLAGRSVQHWISALWGQRVEVAGGVVLCVIGSKILFEHLI